MVRIAFPYSLIFPYFLENKAGCVLKNGSIFLLCYLFASFFHVTGSWYHGYIHSMHTRSILSPYGPSMESGIHPAQDVMQWRTEVVLVCLSFLCSRERPDLFLEPLTPLFCVQWYLSVKFILLMNSTFLLCLLFNTMNHGGICGFHW